MRLVATELAGQAQQQRPRLRPAGRETDLALADIGLDVIELFEEIGVPGDAPVLAVGDGFEPHRLLFLDHTLDFTIFDRLEGFGADLAARALFPCRLERRRAQQAADVIGAERRFTSLHYRPHTSFAISTIIRSLAHCSSSERTLPSSVEAKPHCGDRQSCSRSTYLVASSMRRLMSSFFSSAPLFDVTRPSTICFLPLGKKRKGSNPPARAESYSRK